MITRPQEQREKFYPERYSTQARLSSGPITAAALRSRSLATTLEIFPQLTRSVLGAEVL